MAEAAVLEVLGMAAPLQVAPSRNSNVGFAPVAKAARQHSRSFEQMVLVEVPCAWAPQRMQLAVQSTKKVGKRAAKLRENPIKKRRR